MNITEQGGSIDRQVSSPLLARVHNPKGERARALPPSLVLSARADSRVRNEIVPSCALVLGLSLWFEYFTGKGHDKSVIFSIFFLFFLLLRLFFV